MQVGDEDGAQALMGEVLAAHLQLGSFSTVEHVGLAVGGEDLAGGVVAHCGQCASAS